jgi:hypothetical protein
LEVAILLGSDLMVYLRPEFLSTDYIAGGKIAHDKFDNIVVRCGDAKGG